MYKFFSLAIITLLSVSFVAPTKNSYEKKPPFWAIESRWVDSVFNSLSPDERIAQLFMIPAFSSKDNKHVRETRELIEKYNVGGLIFMKGGPVREAKLTNYYQTKAKTPLLISIDGEWGLAMRLDSTPQYPKQMTLGAIQNDSLIYYMGKQIAKECKLMGIHVNFAPVADINNNPENPVISMRSFGEDKYMVARKSYMYMAGMQDNEVMANGKHFPGHGDTDSDSHKTLPTMNHSMERLDSLELYPFKELFSKDLASIMVAHLNIPILDTTKNRASTLSKNVVTDLLKNKMQYKGLIFTDALNMKGASDYSTPGVLEAKALVAGNDVLLYSENVPLAIAEIKKAIANGEITQAEIDERCKKIIKAKFWCGLNKKQHVHERHIYNNLNTSTSDSLNTVLAEASMTLLQNNNNAIPLKQNDTANIAVVSVGIDEKDLFFTVFETYQKANYFGVSHKTTQQEIDTLLSAIANVDLVVLCVNKANNKANENFGITDASLKLIDTLVTLKPTVSVFFSNPYLFRKLTNLTKHKAIIEAYEYTLFAQKAAADALFGAIPMNAKLPVTAGIFARNAGIEMKKTISTQSSIVIKTLKSPINKKKIQDIDSIALQGIKDECYPGCQIVAMKDGVIFYKKSFGKFTYNGTEKVADSSVYDLASLTKIVSSSLILMKLVEEKKINLDSTLSCYLPELKGTNKEKIIIRDMIAHQAGLQAWIPFYLETIDSKNEFKKGYYSNTESKNYPIRVAENLYIKKEYRDSIYKKITESKLEKVGEYVYSDLGYYYLLKIAEKLTGIPYEKYVQDNFYRPLGISLSYKPRETFNLKNIVPTENDTKFRKQLIRGDVHDPGAAMIGGVAAHAGVFGNAKDVAIVMQMLLKKGKYNGGRYINQKIVEQFTQKCLYCPKNRRGLCFDKPETNEKKDSPVTKECSPMSFGHSGFTGTFAWADPANGLVYVFLSNRVYPDAEKNKLAKSGIRGKIHKLFYEAVEGVELK